MKINNFNVFNNNIDYFVIRIVTLDIFLFVDYFNDFFYLTTFKNSIVYYDIGRSFFKNKILDK